MRAFETRLSHAATAAAGDGTASPLVFENVTEAAQRLRAATMNGAVATAEPEEPSRGVAWLRAGAGNRRPVALEEERPPLGAGASR